MKRRLNREERLYEIERAAIKEGRRHGRKGWVTQTVVAHAMNIKPGSYVLGLLNELFDAGVMLRRKTDRPYQSIRYEFQHRILENGEDYIDF